MMPKPVCVTISVLEQAAAMKRPDVPWAVVAGALGQKTGTLQTLFYAWRKGTLKRNGETPTCDHESFFVPLLKKGLALREIAALWGISRAAAAQRMAYCGYDGPVRQALGEGVDIVPRKPHRRSTNDPKVQTQPKRAKPSKPRRSVEFPPDPPARARRHRPVDDADITGLIPHGYDAHVEAMRLRQQDVITPLRRAPAPVQLILERRAA